MTISKEVNREMLNLVVYNISANLLYQKCYLVYTQLHIRCCSVIFLNFPTSIYLNVFYFFLSVSTLSLNLKILTKTSKTSYPLKFIFFDFQVPQTFFIFPLNISFIFNCSTKLYVLLKFLYVVARDYIDLETHNLVQQQSILTFYFLYSYPIVFWCRCRQKFGHTLLIDIITKLQLCC